MNSTTSLNTNERNAKGKTYSSEHTLYHYAAIDSVDGELCSIEDITQNSENSTSFTAFLVVKKWLPT